MKQLLQNLKNGIIFGLGVLLIFSVTQAWTGLQADSGDTLSATKWNELLARVDNNTSKITNITFTGGLVTPVSLANITDTEDRVIVLTADQAPIGSLVYISLKLHSGGHAKNHYVQMFSNERKISHLGIHSSGHKSDGNNLTIPIQSATDRNIRLNYVNQTGTTNSDGAQLHYLGFVKIHTQ